MAQKPYSIHIYDTLGSTNDTLQEMALAGAPEGTAVLTKHQTAGRGRMGRSFYSPADTGLYLSILLRPDLPPEAALSLTPMAAVSAAEAIAEVTGIQTQIKWVNDLLLGKKKVCGILAQSQLTEDGSRLAHAVIGIGINLQPPREGFPPELAEIAGALYDRAEDVSPQLCENLGEAVCKHIMADYTHLQEKRYLKPYRERLCVLGKPILVAENDTVREAVALDVDDDLRLLVRYADGTEIWRSTGEIRIRPQF